MTVERTENNLPAVRQQQKVAVPLTRPLGDMDQAWRAASILARAGMLPKALYANNPEKTQANVTMILWYGAELGLAPMQALQSIYVVNGRPSMSGQLWLAKVREAGHAVFVACKRCDLPPEQHAADMEHRFEADHDETRCTMTIVRGDTGARHSETFTIEEAQRAGLAGKDIWRSWPKRMLQWRATTNAATTICPEVALGYGLLDGEPDDEQGAAVALAEAVDARTPEPEVVEDDVQDAEVVEDDPAQADEEVREELLRMQAEHQGENGEQADGWPETAEPGSWGGDQ